MLRARRSEPTITDCNLVLGYLDPAGLVGGALKLDVDAARSAIARSLAGPLHRSVEEAAFGMLRLASASMMRAIRAVSWNADAIRGSSPCWRSAATVRCSPPPSQRTRHRTRDRAAAAGRVQRIRSAGGRYRTSLDPEPAHAPRCGRCGARHGGARTLSVRPGQSGWRAMAFRRSAARSVAPLWHAMSGSPARSKSRLPMVDFLPRLSELFGGARAHLWLPCAIRRARGADRSVGYRARYS